MFRGEGSSGAVSVGLRTNRLIGHFPVSGPPGSPDPSTRQGYPQGWLGKGSGRRGDKDAREAEWALFTSVAPVLKSPRGVLVEHHIKNYGRCFISAPQFVNYADTQLQDLHNLT